MSAPRQRPCSALYLHVPFCLQKCPYCSFFSISGGNALYAPYVQAVTKQLQELVFLPQTEETMLETIFFGGGTPSMLPVDALADLLTCCLRTLPHVHTRDMEISIEVNPATIDRRGLHKLRRAGFNRLSIGGQSFDDRELKTLGRPHTATEAQQTFQHARKAGFANINLDLMYGLPGQHVAGWRHTLEQAIALAPEHLSLYELTIEENTPFAGQVRRGSLSMPAEDDVLAMLACTQTLTREAGFIRYEISNYAWPGFQCRHNINYWHNYSYIGLGAGAVGCLDDTRYTVIRDIKHFAEQIAAGTTAWQEKERLTREERFRETVIMGLRMLYGVSLEEMNQRFGINLVKYYGSTLTSLIEQQLLEIDHKRLHLTSRGLLLANTVMAELV